jgi:D-alanyl-D-alanine carboxypeptidase (penicillin-binding protein 5/6)
VAGSVEGFVEMMNQKAIALGAIDSNFNNPSGLPDVNHYTSAYDLAVIARYAMRNQEFRKIVATRNMNIQRTHPGAQTILANSNRMFTRYPGTIGIKTGYTDVAGQCLISSSAKDDRELIAVVLASEGLNIYHDSIALMEFGYNNYQKIPVIQRGEYISYVEVKDGAPDFVEFYSDRSISYSFPVSDYSGVDRDVVIKGEIIAPVRAGEKLGEVVFYNGEVEFARMDLISGQDSNKTWTSYWRVALYVAVFLLAVRLVGMYRRRARRRYYASRRERFYLR